MAGTLIAQQKADILPFLELLTAAKEEHLLECYNTMLKHYSKFRTTSTQVSLDSKDDSSALHGQAGENLRQFVVIDESGVKKRVYLKTRISRNMFKTSLEDLKRLVSRQANDLQQSIAVVVEMRFVANSLGVVFAPYEGISDTVKVMHRYCKLLNDMLKEKFPKAHQEAVAAKNQAEEQRQRSQAGARAMADEQFGAGAEAMADEQFGAGATAMEDVWYEAGAMAMADEQFGAGAMAMADGRFGAGAGADGARAGAVADGRFGARAGAMADGLFGAGPTAIADEWYETGAEAMADEQFGAGAMVMKNGWYEAGVMAMADEQFGAGAMAITDGRFGARADGARARAVADGRFGARAGAVADGLFGAGATAMADGQFGAGATTMADGRFGAEDDEQFVAAATDQMYVLTI